MNAKKASLLVLFLFGILFQNCDHESDDCDFGPYPGEYFDVQGFELINWRIKDDCCNERMMENETVSFANYSSLAVIFTVDYHASIGTDKSWQSSFLNTLHACTPPVPGEQGSMTEKLVDFQVISLNDFDMEHLANDTINDLFQIQILSEDMELNEYLAQDTSLLQSTHMNLKLKKAPELDEAFKVKVVMKLSTGEEYEYESLSVNIME